MKFIKSLSEKQKQDLEYAHKHHSQHRVRLRAQAVLLSARGYTLKQLAALYEVKRDTVSAWLDSWEVGGVKGIEDEAQRYLASAAAVGEYLADQLLLPMALAGGGSFTTVVASSHLQTNAAVIEQFLPVRIVYQPLATGVVQVGVVA